MKVILLKRIKRIGDIGDIKEVADGHALNFLIPQKMAEPATAENISKLKNHKEEATKKAEEDLILAQKNAKKLQGTVMEIKGKPNSEGRLYSSISASTIVDKLKEMGISITKKQVNLLEPIKELGEHSVFIVLDHGLEAEINIIVSE
ncbi:MAG: 50S ribosomal protein L9 [Candidatus Buchananbacteria bacterium]|nr:50S ribosomal protein L9 [Candidatus Buchananbacteria bacterium]